MITINKTILVNNATEAFDFWYKELIEQYKNGEVDQDSRAGKVVGEVINAITIITNPTKGLCESDIRKLSHRYAIGELLWYLSGSNRLEDIQKYTKNWNALTDDDITLNSAYGHRIRHKFGFDQWEYVKDKLIFDQNSRQAVIHIKDASDEPTKDTPCTVCLQFHIREGKLYLTTYMRSNDIWLGFPYDVFAFTSFQVLMAMELGVEIGEYTHITGSLHLYERNVVKIDASSETKKTQPIQNKD